MRANLAQDPKGGDSDQPAAVAAGQCDVTVSNQYYYARLVRSDKADEREAAGRIGIVMPNQKTWGTHVNISAAGCSSTRRTAGGGEVPGIPGKRRGVALLR